MLSEYKQGQKIRHSIIMRLQKVGQTSNGGTFARGTIQDNSGMMNFISFEAKTVDFLKELQGPCTVKITGTVQSDKFSSDGGLQVIIEGAELPNAADDLSHLLPCTHKDIEAYKKTLLGLIDGIHEGYIKELLSALLLEKTVYGKFVKNPAAMRHHHAYIGGLLEHSVDVAKIAKAIAGEFDQINIDLVVAGALLHDIGKIKEISPDIGFEYTETGRFIGHITLGALSVERAVAGIQGFPKQEALELIHIILSHHGDCEKGSPVACVTRESFIVHYADEISAVLNQFDDQGTEVKKQWQYNKMLGRLICLKPEV